MQENSGNNVTKKRSNNTDADDDKSSPAAKKTKEESKEIADIAPVSPTQDPCSSAYDLQANARHKKNAGKSVMWVIYLAIQEKGDSKFAKCIQKCKSIASNSSNTEFSDRLQLDGTRHVTLWEGKMTPKQASQIEFEDQDEIELPIPIGFSNWIPRGAYLQLDNSTEDKLKELVSELDGLPRGSDSNAKTICNHLSLYRSRGMNWKEFSQECAKIRTGVPVEDWGTVQGVGVRLKVMGSDYSHCRVLAGF